MGDQQRRLENGRARLRKIEALTEAIPDSTAKWDELPIGSDLATMANNVNSARQALGFGEIDGWSVVAYQQEYRWRSSHEVHAGLPVFGRYLSSDDDSCVIRDTPQAYPDASDPLVSSADLIQDAHMLQDSVALRFALTGRARRVGRAGGRFVLLDLHDGVQ